MDGEQGVWRGGRTNFVETDGRRRRLKDTAASKVVMHRGKQLTIYKGDKAAEDERWVYITEVKENGTKAYLCILCNKSFVGH